MIDREFCRQEELSKHPISICIVGHTNHGKTSTIRTLTENGHVGTVDDAPDATRMVEDFRVSKNGLNRFYVFDTPGFTNLDFRLAEYEMQMTRSATLDELIEFQKGMPSLADTRLYNTLRQIKRSHLIIQVLDSREDPSIQSYIDEINFLKCCGTPLIVSLNFTHRADSKKLAWQKQIRSLGVSTIIEFDAHTRTWEDEHDLFECMRPLLCDPVHSRLHKEFLDYWSDLRKRTALEASRGAANDIAAMLHDLSRHVTRVDGVNRANRKEKERVAKAGFQESVMEIFNEGAGRVFQRYGFSWGDATKHQNQVEGEETAATFCFFDHSKLKWSASAATLVTGATTEALVAGTTFLIPTVIATGAAYFAVSAFQRNREGDGTGISVRPSTAMLIRIANSMVSVARVLKSRGKANDTMIDVYLENRVPQVDPELVAQIANIRKWKKKELAELKRCIHEAIVRD